MRKFSLLALTLVVAIGLVTAASAHKPEGEEFFAFQFEDCCTPTPDGNLADWGFVPAFYRIGTDLWHSPNRADYDDLGRGEIPRDTFDVVAAFGWNDSSNRVYLMTEVFDDHHGSYRENPGAIWVDDDWEVRWNTSHLDESELALNQGDYFLQGFAVPPVEGVFFGSAGPEWRAPGGPMMDFGWSYEGVMIGDGGSTYRYELSTLMFSNIADTFEDSDFWDLEEGDVVHVGINMVDEDNPDVGGIDHFWAISPGPANEPVNDLRMAEIDDGVDQVTAVQTESWGLIKAGLIK